MDSIQIVAPAAEPLSLAETRTWLRVDTNDEDAAITSLISAARMIVEGATNRRLITQSWRLILDAWPIAGGDGSLAFLATRSALAHFELALQLAPLLSVAGVRVYDSGGQPQNLSTSLWRLVGAPEKPRLVFSATPPQPCVQSAGIEIDVVAGYGAAADVPAPLRHAMLALVAHWYENRGDVETTAPDNLPRRVTALLAPFRRARLA